MVLSIMISAAVGVALEIAATHHGHRPIPEPPPHLSIPRGERAQDVKPIDVKPIDDKPR